MSAVTGPFSFGYSYSQDEDQLQSSAASTTPMLVRTSTGNYTAGVSLRSVASPWIIQGSRSIGKTPIVRLSFHNLSRA
jgi:hypothetical protein